MPSGRTLLVVAALAAGCTDGARRPDARAPERPAATGPGAPAADAGRPPARSPDVGAAELDALATRLDCGREPSTACEALSSFRSGGPPDLAPGRAPGVALSLSGGPAGVALLAIRGEGDGREATWSIVRPNDPADASRLAAIAADLLAGRAASGSIEEDPSVSFARLEPTSGTSLEVRRSPRALARAGNGAVLVLTLDGDASTLAIHRAGSSTAASGSP